MPMSTPKQPPSKRQRDKYSRVICLGCRSRRIRCELPCEIAIPDPGELRTLETPCYRCKRLGVPCVVRQTILGRPSPAKCSKAFTDLRHAETSDAVPRVVVDIELSFRTPKPTPQRDRVEEHSQLANSSVVPRPKSCSLSKDLLTSRDDVIPERWRSQALLLHTPQSTDTVLIIHALDTLRCENVEKEWFRHLPAHVGHTTALDLSIKAIVAACAYSRGVPRLTSSDCYQALALALNAVQADIQLQQNHHGEPSDHILASTALLLPFEGVIKQNGIPTRLHVDGLAAILAARPTSYPVTQLARDIVEFHACETAVMACIQNTPSPFENVARAYYANDRMGCSDWDRGQLKALGKEISIRIPRLVRLVRCLLLQPSPQKQLLRDALRLLESLLRLQDSEAEERMLRNVHIQPSSDSYATLPLSQSLHFASVEDYEALFYYWQGRLSLLRLEWRLEDLAMYVDVKAEHADDTEVPPRPTFGPKTNEALRLANNILMCSECARRLVLHRQNRMFAYGMVVVWAVVLDVPMAFRQYGQGGEVLGQVNDYLLRRVNTALGAKPSLTAEDMDTAAEVFVGGQPRGRFAQLFGL